MALAALILICCTTTAKAEFRYGPTAGLMICHPRFKQVLFPTQDKVGGNIGIMGENIFPGIGLGITAGIEYQYHGAGLSLGDREMWGSQGYGDENVSLHYIAIPIHLRWKWTRLNGLEEKIAPFIYGGPTFGIIAGHSKLEAFDFSHGDLSIDCGLGFELFRHFQISGGYSFGMTYAYKAKILNNFSARTNAWTIRLAYLF